MSWAEMRAADHARRVLVAVHQQVPLKDHVHLEALDAHHTRLGVAEHRARDLRATAAFRGAAQLHRHQ